MRIRAAWWLVAAALVISGCGGGSGGGGGCVSNCPTNVITVDTISPGSGAMNVAINSTVTATFNIGANASTITSSTFTLTAQGGGAVAGTVSVNNGGLGATFTPNAPLAYSTMYTATLTTGVQSTGGVTLASNYTWSFTTAAVPAPTVTAVTPANASTGIAITTAVTATFSEAMNSSTITGSTFTLVPQGGSAVAATVSYNANGNVATLTPTSPLANGTIYTATITTGAMSSGGSALASSYSWTFTTVALPAPTVTSVTPANLTNGVAITSTAMATFSEAMNPATITGSTFTLVPQGGSAVAATVSYDISSMTATLTPSSPLSYNTIYTATITTGVTSSQNTNNTPLAANYSWMFTTATAPAPSVTAVTPASLSTTAAITTTVTATFNQAMNSSTITASSFTLTGPGNTSIQGTVAYNSGSSVATFTPAANLAYNTAYTVTLSTSIMSSTGVALASALYVELHDDASTGSDRYNNRSDERRYGREHRQCADGDVQHTDELIDDYCVDVYADGAGQYRGLGLGHLQHRNLNGDVHAECIAGLQHVVHSDDHDGSNELCRRCAGRKLRVDFHDGCEPEPGDGGLWDDIPNDPRIRRLDCVSGTDAVSRGHGPVTAQRADLASASCVCASIPQARRPPHPIRGKPAPRVMAETGRKRLPMARKQSRQIQMPSSLHRHGQRRRCGSSTAPLPPLAAQAITRH